MTTLLDAILTALLFFAIAGPSLLIAACVACALFGRRLDGVLNRVLGGGP